MVFMRTDKMKGIDMVSEKRVGTFFSMILLILLIPGQAQPGIVEYDLTIARQEVNITGKPVPGMTVNGGIPGPVLRFREGDQARIRVHNTMDIETSIHWHGILVPPDMDGVPYLNFPPIKPGATFTYEFPIRQNGTYWYHSHTGMQEQIGVYGALVIDPIHNEENPPQDHVMVLSDWTDEDPHQVMRTLKQGSEQYALEKGSTQSILEAARLGRLGDYFKRDLQRMPAMDISDLAYDQFLVNGKPEILLPAEPNETLRLRIVDGSATTYFYLEFAGGPMSIVAADGMNVEPIEENRLLIGVAETYDVLISVPPSGAHEFRATAQDGSGYASIWIGSGKRHHAPDVPKPDLYHTMGELGLKQIFSLTPAGAGGMSDQDVASGKFDRPGMMDMGPMEEMHHGADPVKMEMGGHLVHASVAGSPSKRAMDHGHSPPGGMDHGGHSMASPDRAAGTDEQALDAFFGETLAVDGMDPGRPWPPYDRLRSPGKTDFPTDQPVREFRFTLDGDMERYLWFLNNQPLWENDLIRIRQGEVVRFIMINRTMMHHPMHLHGHFFRVINGQGDHAPLKHTVNVAPMSTTVIEFDANEFGDWFFHCHLLYHMESGMARVVHYEGFDSRLGSLRPGLYTDFWYFWGQVDLLSHMAEASLTASNTRNILNAELEAGWQQVDNLEGELIFTWDRYINAFFSVFAGADLHWVKKDIQEERAVFGFRYLLPLLVESRTWVDSDGEARLALEKSFDLTPHLALFGAVQYDTGEMWEGLAGLRYRVNKDLSLVGQWHSDYGLGGGLQIRF